MSKEIRCPNCGTMIQIDESTYQTILDQVRSEEFEKEISSRERTLRKEYEGKEELLKNRNDAALKELRAQKDLEIARLKSELSGKELQSQIAVKEAVEEKQQEIFGLKEKINSEQNLYLEKENSLKNDYENKLLGLQKEVEYYKDFKARQSTKLIGESLEQHCFNEFNKLRPLFPNAYFEKDNVVSKETGSKGDFIYRDYDEEGTEFLSVMFEMKNEADETATKHRNDQFFKELDKDRREKGCEYAVLVSMLEADNDLYNNGIVDVSHVYPKMYVVRPQFFIPIITLLRNAALNTVGYKKELIRMQEENIDISHFEENMNTFKEGFARNYRLASERFAKAIEEIDKTIDHLQKTKENLLKTDDNLRLANNKAQDLSIKKLTKNAPSMAKRFEEEKEKDL
ncbi:MAG: DUF2130 domain-containing protein [Erysipelotrichaceae bacterium]|nr:DUF2130 domain-containing protein [Erysipelotrichaceae bacterium]